MDGAMGYSDTALRGWRKTGVIRKQGQEVVAKTLSEPAGPKGAGSLLLERRSADAVEVYLAMRVGGTQRRIKLGGLFDIGAGGRDLGIAYWREEVARVSGEVRQHGDIDRYEEHLRQSKITEQKRIDAEAARASLADLFADYIEDRRDKVSADQLAKFERFLEVDLQERSASISGLKARDVLPGHVLEILRKAWDRGAKGLADKQRAWLHAAFAFGLKAEHSLARASAKTFGLISNPVALLPKEYVPTPGTRTLTDQELQHFWGTITEISTVGPVMARLFQFIIALGGQRVDQVTREPWESYDFEARTLRLIDAKGRGGVRRVHLVPLTERALAILAEVKEITGKHKWPWTTTGRSPINVSSPVHAVSAWLDTEHGKLDGKQVERFGPRDLRRTCSQIMQRNGVEDRLSDLLQSHGVSGVVAAHYRNNPEGYLPEKRRAVEQFERALSKILVTGKASEKK
jgi:integrase